MYAATFFQPTRQQPIKTMASPSQSTIQTLLRYTYRANIVFFAGFGAWYMLKGPGRGQEQDIASLTRRGDVKAADRTD